MLRGESVDVENAALSFFSTKMPLFSRLFRELVSNFRLTKCWGEKRVDVKHDVAQNIYLLCCAKMLFSRLLQDLVSNFRLTECWGGASGCKTQKSVSYCPPFCPKQCGPTTTSTILIPVFQQMSQFLNDFENFVSFNNL